MKFEHGLSFNILLKSNNENPTGYEIKNALENALKDLDVIRIKDAVEIFDSIEIEE